ncbi:redox-regulated ATPase YchF [Mycoplasma iguanae]|uniref:Ribosome-binding ATPase YchF n=1 Tax=Mycoplasma iguanae TaxID=292461 RepID=A0ABY5RCD7_9MOLU|nr:redox-regulated ATPase YchF [Mycoplasma iguanae]UVD82002.1 redox-regulated ATPase YchF [Mycoplasma iguanae]
MSLKAGIVGLPNVGKSTLFSALTRTQVESANYAFTTIEPNISIVELNDNRLHELAKIVKPERILPATFQFVDIAGLVEGASKGEGLGNKFLANIREVDAIIQVVRCFEDDDIVHVANSINPLRDLEIINLELLLSDMTIIENVLKRVTKKAQNTSDAETKIEYELALKLQKAFEQNIQARELDYSEKELKFLKSYQLLTLKPILYVANIAQNDIDNLKNNSHYKNLEKWATAKKVTLLPISIKLEHELSQLDQEDFQAFLKEYNLKYSGLDLLTQHAFKLLNLSTYFTAGILEVRAWTFTNGMLAPQCAGIIHSDFEKKFIKAEVISYLDYIQEQGEKNAKENGKMRLEGKTYIMQDGDVCHFKFGK